MFGKKTGGIVLLFLLLIELHGLDPQKKLTQFSTVIISTEQGLPQTAVNAVAQGADGYVWVGTQGGIGRYDGIRFKIYSSKQGVALKSDYLSDLLWDSRDRMWCGTLGGGLFWIIEGEFHQILEGGISFEQGNIRDLYQDRRQQIWIGTDRGLFWYREGEIKRVFPDQIRDSVRSIAEDRQGNLWIGVYGAGLYEIRGDTLHDHRDQIHSRSIRSVVTGPRGRIWVSTTDRGLFCREPEGWRQFTTRDGLPINYITALFFDSDGVLWVGTMGKGIGRLINGRFVFNPEINKRVKYVQSIFEDSDGNIWVALYIAGILRITHKEVFPYGVREGLSNDVVWSVFEDSRENIWVGTNRGINWIDPSRTRIQFLDETNGLGSSPVRSITEDRGGDIWAGTDGDGLVKIRGNRVVRKLGIHSGLPSNTVYSLYRDSRDQIWIGTASGLCRMSRDRLFVQQNPPGLRNTIIRTLGEDADGYIWVGTEGAGLFCIRGDQIDHYTLENGLSDDLITSLYFDRDRTLWIGTLRGGLNEYREGRFFQYRMEDGLFDNITYSILEDGAENLWMSSNYGIYTLSKQQLRDFSGKNRSRLSCTVVGREDGMRNQECNGGCYPAGVRSQDGSLWFPTMEGVVRVDPEGVLKTQKPPPVVLEEFIVDDRRYQRVHFKDRILRLEPGRKRIEFRFTAFHFPAPGKIVFKHQLEGFDEQWVEGGKVRFREYTNIPPGRYRFQVKASVDHQDWSPEGDSLSFAVAPFFTQTVWFYLLMAALLGGLAFAISYLRFRNLARRKVVLEKLVQNRTEELNQANARLRELSRRDPLTRIANRREFNRVFDLTWRRCLRAKIPVSLVLIDIDFFKRYNDTYGHQLGDQVLLKVARTLSRVARRAEDLTARYGGEEFIIILPDTDGTGAFRLSEQCLERIRALGIAHESSGIVPVLTVSIGYATMVPTMDSRPGTLIKMADMALYRAKTEGRNCIRGIPDEFLPG